MSSGQPPWLAPGEGAVKKRKGVFRVGASNPNKSTKLNLGRHMAAAGSETRYPPLRGDRDPPAAL